MRRFYTVVYKFILLAMSTRDGLLQCSKITLNILLYTVLGTWQHALTSCQTVVDSCKFNISGDSVPSCVCESLTISIFAYPCAVVSILNKTRSQVLSYYFLDKYIIYIND